MTLRPIGSQWKTQDIVTINPIRSRMNRYTGKV